MFFLGETPLVVNQFEVGKARSKYSLLIEKTVVNVFLIFIDHLHYWKNNFTHLIWILFYDNVILV